MTDSNPQQNTTSNPPSQSTPHAPPQSTPPSGKIQNPKPIKKIKSGTPRGSPRFSKEVDSKGIPIDFKDPISQLIMSDPVSTAAGSTYERESIERWLDTSDVDPITGTKLKSKLVYPNNALKNQISLFLEAQPRFKQYVCTQGEYTLERIENLLKEENNIHEITKLIRKSVIFEKKDTKQNILHILFANSCSVGYIEKVLEQKNIQDQLPALLSQRDFKGRLPFVLGLSSSFLDVFKYCVNNYFDQMMAEPAAAKEEVFEEDRYRNLAEHLMDCCTDGFLNGAIALKHFGQELNFKLEYSDFSPIEEAAYNGHLQLMIYLIEEGNLGVESFNRALGSAAEGHHPECIKLCFDKGADVNSTDNSPPPISRAVGDLQTVIYLVSLGANINVDCPTIMNEPSTPLSAAAQYEDGESEESLRVIDYLLEQGANIDYQDDRGWAAIHYAVRSLNKKAIGKLIENECNVDLITNEKQTVYDIADEYGTSESLGDEDSVTEEDRVDEGQEGPEDEEDEIPSEDIVPLSPSDLHLVEDIDPYDHMDGDEIIIDDDEDHLDDEFDAEAIKEFIREHSALVKRLRLSMMKKDVSNISKGLVHMEKKYNDLVSLVSYQSELLKRLCEKANVDTETDNTPLLHNEMMEESSLKKRKRKKSISVSQKNKKKRLS